MCVFHLSLHVAVTKQNFFFKNIQYAIPIAMSYIRIAIPQWRHQGEWQGGATTEGVTPLIFSWKTWRPFLVANSLYFSPEKLKRFFFFFSHHCHFFYFTPLSPPLECVTPHLFYLSHLVSPLFFVNFPTRNFPSDVTSLEGYVPISIENRHFCSNVVSLAQKFRYLGSSPPIIVRVGKLG